MNGRRAFLRSAAAAVPAVLAGASALPAGQAPAKPGPFAKLRPLTGDVVPIADAERHLRIERARRLMVEAKLDAVIVEGGTSLVYFTDVSWWLSERAFHWVLPAKGEPGWVCPKFEEDRAREQVRFGTDIRTWEEDEDPYAATIRLLRDRGLRTGRIGLEEKSRFFVFDGLRRAGPGYEFASADPVTAGCRMIKSPAELALMQKAMDITVEAYKATLGLLREGMSKGDFSALAAAAHTALGVTGGISASFGEQSALPHGSIKPRTLGPGDLVLTDGGCGVEGYRSDISRAVVFGTPTDKLRRIWDVEKKAQAAAFRAAGPGVPCEAVDLAARKVLVENGLGPDYKLPGLPHRTGHGIGLDGHEWTYLVRGNKTLTRAGMCFTNEPMIVVPGEFGIRLEDCFYITESGPKWFTQPSPSIEKPFV
jgi:Xaa-Pro dipeptidase